MAKTKIIAGFIDSAIGQDMPADSTLNKMTKEQLIGLLKVANQNYRILLYVYSHVSKRVHRQDDEIVKLREMLHAMSGLSSHCPDTECIQHIHKRPAVIYDKHDHCTVTQCYYNNDLYCTCCDDVRDASMLEECPSYMED